MKQGGAHQNIGLSLVYASNPAVVQTLAVSQQVQTVNSGSSVSLMASGVPPSIPQVSSYPSTLVQVQVTDSGGRSATLGTSVSQPSSKPGP